MTTTIAFATSDGQIKSSSTSYATAQAGANHVITTNGSLVRAGQNLNGSTYEIWEAFFAVPYTVPSNEIVVSTHFSLWSDVVTGSGVSRDLGLRTYAWGTLEAADWRTVSGINAQTRVGLAGAVNLANDDFVFLSEENFNDDTSVSGTHQFVCYTSRFTSSDVPTGGEYNDFASSEAGGTSTDPALVFTSIMTHTLVRLSGCHVQLSDGRHVFIEASTGGSFPTLTLKLQDPPAAATNIATNLLDGSRDMGSSNQSMQQYALCRDSSDNLYWIGHAGGLGNSINVVAFKKTGASTWAEQGEKQAAMPANDGIINNLVATWHNVGTNGTLMVVGSHETNGVGPDPVGQMFYALLSCNYLLNGSGSLLRGSGDAFTAGLVSPSARSVDHNNFLNEVGTSLDIASLADTDRGVLGTLCRTSIPGEYAPVSVCRYILNSGGTAITSVARDAGGAWSTKDAAAKIRILPISSTQFVVVSIDKDSGWGPTVRVLQNIGTSSTFTLLAEIRLDDEAVASLPEPTDLDQSSAWDAAYHPAANEVLFWYFDVANGRRLMRTTVNLATYQAVRNEVEVASAVGASGSTNHAIRVQRGPLAASEVIVTAANRTSGGTQGTVYVTDALNAAPLAPTLVEKVNYDATTGAIFDWTFNDLNVGDTQTAYEVEIDNADTLANVVDTGKVVSSTSERNVTGGTLSNGVNYRWRVRTWDTSDAVGAWSQYDFFSTAAGGSLTITSPATDNAPLILDEVTVTWSVAGMTQAKYRVRVVNNITSVEISNTGVIVSTATSHLVTGLASDVEHRIEVTAYTSGDVPSNTATRLVTPNYNEPEIPLVTVTAQDALGHILVDVTNPTPTGDRPEATSNNILRRRLGDSNWVTVASVAYNGDYQDWHTGSGITYEYKVQAVASIGVSESAVLTATLALMGVWLHLPQDPAGTAINLLYGANQRGDTITSYAELTHYAGREDPVADFAHYQDRVFNAVVDIPYGNDYHTQLDALDAMITSKQTMVYRDNRRRNAFGTVLGGLTKTDTATGTQASFDFTKVSYNEEVV